MSASEMPDRVVSEGSRLVVDLPDADRPHLQGPCAAVRRCRLP